MRLRASGAVLQVVLDFQVPDEIKLVVDEGGKLCGILTPVDLIAHEG